MKKFLFMLVAAFTFATVNAQDAYSNYAGSSKFTDNWSATVQGGVTTPFTSFFKGHTACEPVVSVELTKFITPWLGVGVEGSTVIGTGCNLHNSHTAFDEVAAGGNVFFNVMNIVNPKKSHLVEPLVFTGLGWNHTTCSHVGGERNAMYYTAGVEVEFNLTKSRNLALAVTPSVNWVDITNGRLVKSHGNFQVTAGIVYRFKSSNGKRHMSPSPVPALLTEVNTLKARVAELENASKEVVTAKSAPVTNAVAQVVRDTVVINNNVVTLGNAVAFRLNSAEVDATQMANLAKVADALLADNTLTVTVKAFADKATGTAEYNQTLSERRANAVKAVLVEKFGVDASRVNTVGVGATEQPFGENDWNRVAVFVTK